MQGKNIFIVASASFDSMFVEQDVYIGNNEMKKVIYRYFEDYKCIITEDIKYTPPSKDMKLNQLIQWAIDIGVTLAHYGNNIIGWVSVVHIQPDGQIEYYS